MLLFNYEFILFSIEYLKSTAKMYTLLNMLSKLKRKEYNVNEIFLYNNVCNK